MLYDIIRILVQNGSDAQRVTREILALIKLHIVKAKLTDEEINVAYNNYLRENGFNTDGRKGIALAQLAKILKEFEVKP